MKAKIIDSIYKAIDEVNLQLDSEHKLEKTLDTILFGSGGTLDSLGLVNLIVALEQCIEEDFGTTIDLANEETMFSRENNLFESVEKLSEYLFNQLVEDNG